jgi:hypothetical protein
MPDAARCEAAQEAGTASRPAPALDAGEAEAAFPEPKLAPGPPLPADSRSKDPAAELGDESAEGAPETAADPEAQAEETVLDLPPAAEIAATVAAATGRESAPVVGSEEPLPLSDPVDAVAPEPASRPESAPPRAEALQKQRPGPRQTAAGPRPKTAKPPGHQPSKNSSLVSLLRKYRGKRIGINYDNTADIREALLLKATPEYFTVAVKRGKLQFNFPLKTVLTVVEGPDGVDIGSGGKNSRFAAVIKVYPLVSF